MYHRCQGRSNRAILGLDRNRHAATLQREVGPGEDARRDIALAFPNRRIALLLALCALAVVALVSSATPAAAQERATIPVGDLWFCDESFEGGVCQTTISAGDTVVWDFSPAAEAHTTTECGASCDNPTRSPLWDSGVISDGSSFQRTFTQPGAFLYLCEVHAFEMRGRIVVRAAQPTPTTSPVDLVAPGTATPTGPGAPGAPKVGYGPSEGSSVDRWTLGALAAAGAALLMLGASAYRRARVR